MKTYTFKIREDYFDTNNEKRSRVLVAIHCPMEVFYDSLKLAKEFENMEHCYITRSDYVDVFSRAEKDAETGEEITLYDYVEHNEEITLCTVNDVFDSKDYINFMTNCIKVKEDEKNEIS